MCSLASLHDVTRLIVTYNSSDVLEYSSLPSDQVRTLAVDNASTDMTAHKAGQLGYDVLPLPKNLGYANAIMAGLQEAETDFVLIANPDVQISITAIQQLLQGAADHPDCSLFIPRIIRPDGSEFFRHETRFDKRVKDRRPPQRDQEVSTVSGAVMLVRKDAFIANGGFDTNIFLYFEDDELSLRYRNLKQPMYFVADAKAHHIGDGSSGNELSVNRIKDVSFGWSWGYLMKKMHLGNRWLTLGAILAKLMAYLVSFRTQKARRQIGIIEGFVRNLAGQPAPFLHKID